jgi:hypothetical protein
MSLNRSFNVKGDINETHNRLPVADACFHRRCIWSDFATEVAKGRLLRNMLSRWLRAVLLPEWLRR